MVIEKKKEDETYPPLYENKLYGTAATAPVMSSQYDDDDDNDGVGSGVGRGGGGGSGGSGDSYGSLGTDEKMGMINRGTSEDVGVSMEEVQHLVQGGTDNSDHEGVGFSVYLILMSFILSLSTFQFGYAIGAPNQPKEVIVTCPPERDLNAFFQPCIPMNDIQWAIAVSLMFPLGGLIGGLTGGSIADWFGRKRILWLNNVITLISTLILSLTSNMYVFFVGRFIVGIGAGIASVVVPMYLGEISPSKIRGALGSLSQLQITGGILVAQTVGVPLSDPSLLQHQAWRIIFAIPALFSILQIIVLPLFPESPRWLLSKKDPYAESALKRLRSSDNVNSELKSIEKSMIKDLNQKGSILDLLRLSLLKSLVIGIGLQLAQQLSGVNVVFFYSTSFFGNAGIKNANVATVLIGLINVLATVMSFFLIDRLGRRILLILGEIGSFVFFSGLALCFIFQEYVPWLSYLSVVCVILFVIAFAASLGPIPWLILAELFPGNVRGYASSIAVGVNWIATCLVGTTFPSLEHLLGKYVFLPYAVAIFISLIFTIILVPETKGKSIEELTSEK